MDLSQVDTHPSVPVPKQPSGSLQQSTSRHPAVADGWVRPELGQACLNCSEDELCFLRQLSPVSNDPQENSQRLTVELSGNWPFRRVPFREPVNMLITSEFTVSACVHGEGRLRSICIKFSSVQSTVACQDERINRRLFLSSSALKVRAAYGSTALGLQMALDEYNPGCELRILRHDTAPFNIDAGDGFTWSVHPKFKINIPGGGGGEGDFFTIAGTRTGNRRLVVASGDPFNVDVCKADAGAPLLDRCRAAMAATNTWDRRHELAFTMLRNDGAVVFAAPLRSDAAEVVVRVKPIVGVIRFPREVTLSLLVQESAPTADHYDLPECRIAVACPPVPA